MLKPNLMRVPKTLIPSNCQWFFTLLIMVLPFLAMAQLNSPNSFVSPEEATIILEAELVKITNDPQFEEGPEDDIENYNFYRRYNFYQAVYEDTYEGTPVEQSMMSRFNSLKPDYLEHTNQGGSNEDLAKESIDIIDSGGIEVINDPLYIELALLLKSN